jgi:hypothetical protein
MTFALRIGLFRYGVFNVNTRWEITRFVDRGAVARDFLDVTAKSFVADPGIGFGAAVRPNVVGRVDIGFGKEGPAVVATLAIRSEGLRSKHLPGASGRPAARSSNFYKVTAIRTVQSGERMEVRIPGFTSLARTRPLSHPA